MKQIQECPVCHNQGLEIDIDDGYKVVTNGKKRLKDLPCVAYCKVCKRKIKYSVEKKD